MQIINDKSLPFKLYLSPKAHAVPKFVVDRGYSNDQIATFLLEHSRLSARRCTFWNTNLTLILSGASFAQNHRLVPALAITGDSCSLTYGRSP